MKNKLYEEKPQRTKNKNEGKPQNEEIFFEEKIMKKNPQMKKSNVENFKEVTHEIEFMLFQIYFR